MALDVGEVSAARSFGRFAYAAERSELWAEVLVLGDDPAQEELAAAITAVAELGDGEDDRLQAAHCRYADLTGKPRS